MKYPNYLTRCSLAVLVLLSAYAPANATNEHRELERRNEAVVRGAFASWSSGSGSVFDILAPDVDWTILGSGPVAGTYNGAKDFLERASQPLVERLAAPLVPNVHHVWTSQDRVIVRFDASSTTTSGTPYRNQFVWIFRMENERVVEAEAFLDLAAYQDVVDNNEPRAR